MASSKVNGWFLTMTVNISRSCTKDFHILSFTRINNLAQRYDGGCEYPEVIITNYDPTERQQAESRQMNLFDYENEGEEEDEFYRTNEMG